MTLRLHDQWIWDFWLITEAGEHHVFFLKAPKAIGDPELRHWNVSIGRAVSNDLHDWTLADDVVAPSPSSATGCSKPTDSERPTPARSIRQPMGFHGSSHGTEPRRMAHSPATCRRRVVSR